MQLVEAKKSFIRRPFLWSYVQLGLLAIDCIGTSRCGAVENASFFPRARTVNQPLSSALVFVLVLVLGISISFLSTYFATQRYLNLNTEAIY